MALQPKTVSLTEWDSVRLDYDAKLNGGITREQALSIPVEALKGKVKIRPRLDGLEIETSSFVGRVDLGPLRLVIRPKIHKLPLTTLLRYAYSLRELSILDESETQTAEYALQDLLVSLLVAEVEELVHRGLTRAYVPLATDLESLRGRIDFNALGRAGGVRKAQLPCHYFERRTDGLLNQVLRAGLDLAAGMASDHDLRRVVHRLAARFADVRALPFLNASHLDRAEQSLTRLTDSYGPALTLVRLLLDMQGVDLEVGRASRTPGFLFDMNAFYQRLLSRFFHENLVGWRIEDEHKLRSVYSYAPKANPRRRRPPMPRPDFALFHKDGLHGFLDAKYRDAWALDIPAHWLYQLSIYAFASPSRVSVLLYATMHDEATDQQIDVRHPLSGQEDGSAASVILRPIHLGRLATLVAPQRGNSVAADRQAFARESVQLSAHKANIAIVQSRLELSR